MFQVYYSHEAQEGKDYSDHITVYSTDYTGIYLFGDYRGVQLASIKYVPSVPESVASAEQIAMDIINAQVARGSEFINYRGRQNAFNVLRKAS